MRGLIAAAAGLLLAGASLTPALAQTPPPGGAPCQPGAPPVTSTRQEIGPTRVVGLGGRFVFIDRDVSTITTTDNYKGVLGLTLIVRQDPDLPQQEILLPPDWLLRAYGGNVDAIRADLARGFLANRGPCPDAVSPYTPR